MKEIIRERCGCEKNAMKRVGSNVSGRVMNTAGKLEMWSERAFDKK